MCFLACAVFQNAARDLLLGVLACMVIGRPGVFFKCSLHRDGWMSARGVWMVGTEEEGVIREMNVFAFVYLSFFLNLRCAFDCCLLLMVYAVQNRREQAFCFFYS